MNFKIIILILIMEVFCTSRLYSQDANSDCKKDESTIKYDAPEYDDAKITLQRVICVPDLPKDKIYQLSREFFTNNFNCGECVLDLEDKDNGIMIGKGNVFSHRFKHLATINVYLHFSIKVECKKGRYRFTLYDLKQSTANSSNSKSPIENIFNPEWKMGKKARKQQQVGFLSTLESLRKLIIKEINQDKTDDEW